MSSVYIISELCGQWGGSVERAEQMILQSKMGGASAVKVQLYDTYRMPGENRERWEYLSMTRDQFTRLKEYSDSLNIDFFASAFHADRFSWLLESDIRINKIASSLEQIEQDDYGYCYSCGIEIGLKRLEARPTATHCIDCKTLDEIKEKQLGG